MPALARTARTARLTRSAALAAAAALVGGVLAGCSSPAKLVPDLDDHAPAGGGPYNTDDAVSGPTLSFQPGTNLCAKRAVRIESMTLVHPTSGIRLVAWGFDNKSDSVTGSTEDSLTRLGRFDSHTIARTCDDDAYARLGIEVRLTGSDPQHYDGLRLTYRSDSETITGYLANSARLHRTH